MSIYRHSREVNLSGMFSGSLQGAVSADIESKHK
jgi:hypothetical protein